MLRTGFTGALPVSAARAVDDRDSCPERRVYIHFGGIEQARVLCGPQGSDRAAGVAGVARVDVGQHLVIGDEVASPGRVRCGGGGRAPRGSRSRRASHGRTGRSPCRYRGRRAPHPRRVQRRPRWRSTSAPRTAGSAATTEAASPMGAPRSFSSSSRSASRARAASTAWPSSESGSPASISARATAR